MPRLILIVAVATIIYILYQRTSALPPHKRKAGYVKLAIGAAAVVVLGLTLAGKMHWVGAALTGALVAARQLLPTLVRVFPMLASLRSQAAPAAGQSSTVETALLRMHLDHDSGNMEGEVLEGAFKEWRLADMDQDQLAELVAFCQQRDADSVQLLEGYLAQRFPDAEPFKRSANTPPSGGGPMTRAEALAVLGLTDDADQDQIVSAHRKLMQKLHPDRGGNDYLAAKINQAKDFLTG